MDCNRREAAMSEYTLSAVIEMKDKFSSGIKKAQGGFNTFSKSLTGMPSVAARATESIDKMGESAVQAAQKTAKLKTNLSGIRGVYAATVRVKDDATATLRKAQTELNQFKGKTYTAIVNVKNNMVKAGGVGGKLSNGMSNMAGGMLMGTSLQMAGAAGIGYGIYDTIKTYMDFEAQLSEIKALTGLDAAAMDQVKEKAMELGQATVFGNTEVAKGMAELLKAGVDIKDVLGDASEAALNLAVAGDIALPDAAEIMSTAMNAFKVDDATHAADILAGAANASATSVGELKYSLAACSAVAAGAGMSFDDTNTALAVFAQNGLKGSDAGTSLKTMLSNLVPKGKTAIAAFEKLNLLTENGSSAFFDEAGKMKSLADIAGLLNNRLKDMTKEEQLSTLYDMFGSDAIRGGMILLREGADGVTQMFNEMGKVTAKDVAITRMDNLKGDIEQLSGAWENFQDTLMDSHNSFGLRGFITELTDVVQYAGTVIKDGFDFSDVFKIAGKGINDLKNKFLEFDGVGSVLAGGVLAAGLYKITKLALKAKDAVTGLGGTKLGGGIGDAAGMTREMVVNAQTVIVNGLKSASGNGTTILGPDGKPMKQKPMPTGTSIPKASSRWSKLLGRAPIIGTALALGSSALDVAYAPEGQRGTAAASAIGGLGGMWAGGKLGAMSGAAIGSIFGPAGTAVGGAIGGIAGGAAGYFGGSALGETVANAIDLSSKWDAIKKGASETWDWIKNGAATAVQSLSDTWGAISSWFSSNIWEPIKNDAIGALNFIVGIGAVVWDAIEPYWDAAVNWIDSNVWQPIADFASSCWSGITDVAKSCWDSVTGAFSTAADWFDSNVWQPITSSVSGPVTAIENGFSEAVGSIKSAFGGLADWFNENVWEPIKSRGSSAWGWISNNVSYVQNRGSKITGLSGHATGSSYFEGGLTQINEHGGEIVDLPQGSRIYPAATTQRIIEQQMGRSRNSSGGILFTGNTFVVREEDDIDKIAHQLFQLAEQANLNYGGDY
jgi:TP901 family phage tail tape measure protein